MAVEEPLKKTYQVCISPLFLYIFFFLNFIFLCILFSNFLVAIEQKKKARYFFFLVNFVSNRVDPELS